MRDQDRHEVVARPRDRRFVVRPGDRRHLLRVLPVPPAGLGHEVDHAPFAQEGERRDGGAHAELIGAEQATRIGRADRADRVHPALSKQRRECVEQFRSIVVARHDDDGPVRTQAEQCAEPEGQRLDGRDRTVEHVAGDDHEIDALLVGDPNDLVERGPCLVGSVVPAEAAADVPIRGMEDPHGLEPGERVTVGVAGHFFLACGPRRERERR